jgi:hypothetical protein
MLLGDYVESSAFAPVAKTALGFIGDGNVIDERLSRSPQSATELASSLGLRDRMGYYGPHALGLAETLSTLKNETGSVRGAHIETDNALIVMWTAEEGDRIVGILVLLRKL